MTVQSEEKIFAVTVVQSCSSDERHLLLAWAKQVIAIRNSPQSAAKKAAQIALVTKNSGLRKVFLTQFATKAKKVLWTDRSGPMKGVVGGAGIGLVASIASPMAGVAAFGGAVAVPVVLLGAGAGAVLAALVDELTRAADKNQ